ncbi:SCO family protein [Stenoxybacter acetivorans]|uniref:SCO family protein n=1 Tax=Stenoxybacter acetivorans TaxID=422441 RepID=UPI00056B0D80|nr:SCO family protein [Stenoxybacter acetivorans]
MKPITALWCACALLTAALTACGGSAEQNSTAASAPTQASASTQTGFSGSDIRADHIGGDFTLLGPDNKPVSLHDFQGKVVALSFGYTHCPDVCPANLLIYADALKQLGERAKDVQVLFISVDPDRDTPQLLAQYAPAFYPDFIGLTVKPDDGAALAQVKQQYRIVSSKVPSDIPNQYLVDHSAGTYLIDQNGKAAVYEPYGQTAAQLAHDINLLLDGS